MITYCQQILNLHSPGSQCWEMLKIPLTTSSGGGRELRKGRGRGKEQYVEEEKNGRWKKIGRNIEEEKGDEKEQQEVGTGVKTWEKGSSKWRTEVLKIWRINYMFFPSKCKHLVEHGGRIYPQYFPPPAKTSSSFLSETAQTELWKAK